MEHPAKNPTALFDVYLRLRPPILQSNERFIEVNPGNEDAWPTHITLNPLSQDHRRPQVEKYAFTRVFDEHCSQLELFRGTGVAQLVEGVLGEQGKAGRDGLLATLGVTGSGKSYTIHGSRSQRGLGQLTLEILYNSVADCLVSPDMAMPSIATSDTSEARFFTATAFLESVYGNAESRANSRAQTPMAVSTDDPHAKMGKIPSARSLRSFFSRGDAISTARDKDHEVKDDGILPNFASIADTVAKLRHSPLKDTPHISYIYSPLPKRLAAPKIPTLPQQPRADNILIPADETAEYAIVVSMYELYNNTIYDLFAGSNPPYPLRTLGKESQRRAVLFRNTESSPDKKVVAGLKKIVCGTFEETLHVLEAGLTERRVAGTALNAVSSRSHAFFNIEVKKRIKNGRSAWVNSTLCIADLAGSERARDAKTAGATLGEAGQINLSLMYLGQCMQQQADNGSMNSSDTASNLPTTPAAKSTRAPWKHSKLTELLFSNSFNARQQPQKGIMIVTADPQGDFYATSQVLKYSALAKEVTVPRYPSFSETILAQPISGGTGSRPGTANQSQRSASGQSTCTSGTIAQSEAGAADRVAELLAELDAARTALAEETFRRHEAEAAWADAEERLEGVEADIRDECWNAFEQQLDVERRKWAAAWEEERLRSEGHIDGKLEVLMRSIRVREDSENEEVDELRQRLEDMEIESDVLRERLANADREKMARTPSKKLKVLKTRPWTVEALDDDENFDPIA